MGSVRFEGVSKRFGKVEAVRDLNLDIPDGQFMTLVGPSGCGKSTTLNMLAGLEEVTEGEIYIDDREVSGLPPGDRDIAMVFQSYALYPHMSVRDNLAFALKVRHEPREAIQQKVARAAQAARDRGAARSQTAPTLRRPAAAGGARPRARPRAASLSPR